MQIEDFISKIGALEHRCITYNIDFFKFDFRLANHKEFAAGDVDTDFIQRNYDDLFPANISAEPR